MVAWAFWGVCMYVCMYVSLDRGDRQRQTGAAHRLSVDSSIHPFTHSQNRPADAPPPPLLLLLVRRALHRGAFALVAPPVLALCTKAHAETERRLLARLGALRLGGPRKGLGEE